MTRRQQAWTVAVDITQKWDAPIGFVIAFLVLWLVAAVFVVRGLVNGKRRQK